MVERTWTLESERLGFEFRMCDLPEVSLVKLFISLNLHFLIMSIIRMKHMTVTGVT